MKYKLVNAGDILQRYFDRFNKGLYYVHNNRKIDYVTMNMKHFKNVLHVMMVTVD